MNKYKRRLMAILLVQVIITIIHNTSESRFDASNFFQAANITYWLGMGWGLFALIYAIKLGCADCGARQVFRGFSVFSLRWPQDNCHQCGRKIK